MKITIADFLLGFELGSGIAFLSTGYYWVGMILLLGALATLIVITYPR